MLGLQRLVCWIPCYANPFYNGPFVRIRILWDTIIWMEERILFMPTRMKPMAKTVWRPWQELRSVCCSMQQLLIFWLIHAKTQLPSNCGSNWPCIDCSSMCSCYFWAAASKTYQFQSSNSYLQVHVQVWHHTRYLQRICGEWHRQADCWWPSHSVLLWEVSPLFSPLFSRCIVSMSDTWSLLQDYHIQLKGIHQKTKYCGIHVLPDNVFAILCT